MLKTKAKKPLVENKTPIKFGFWLTGNKMRPVVTEIKLQRGKKKDGSDKAQKSTDVFDNKF